VAGIVGHQHLIILEQHGGVGGIMVRALINVFERPPGVDVSGVMRSACSVPPLFSRSTSEAPII